MNRPSAAGGWDRSRLSRIVLMLALSSGLIGFALVYWKFPLYLVFLAVALVLELRCAFLPVFGVFSTGAAIVLGASLVAGPVVGFATGCLVVFARILLLNRIQWWPGLCEGLFDLTVLGLSMLVLWLQNDSNPALSWPLVLSCYCLSAQGLKFFVSLGFEPLEKAAWEQAHRSLWLANLCVVLGGVLVWTLSRLHPFAWLLVVPALGLISELVQERLRLGAARRELAQLERLSNQTSACMAASECFKLALATLTSSLTVQSVAFFSSIESQPSTLRPEVWQSPFAKRLESGQTKELIVERALKLNEPVLYSQEFGRQRIFEGETVAVAYPLAGQGVFYVGRLEGVFTLEEQQFLTGFTQRLSLALLMMQQRQAKEKALHSMSQAKVALEHELGLLAVLLDGSRKFSATLQSNQLLAELQTLLERHLPHNAGEVWLDPSAPSFRWGASPAEVSREIVTSVVNSGQPLVVPNLSGEAAGRYCSALCVPIASESQVHGGILLLSHRASAFSKEQQQLLWALGYSLAAALTNARLFSDVVQARRDLEKSQVQLVHASKLNAIGEIAAGVAHEINSPLGAVVVTLELIQSLLPPDQAKNVERLARAQQSLSQAREIVSKLLVYSVRASTRVESVALDQLVADTFVLFGASWTKTGIEVVNRVPAGLSAMCRASEMQQVVVHLVSNASEACSALGSERQTVIVSARELDKEVVLEVTDQGRGIAAQDFAKIFEPFVTTKTSSQGAGLGLSVCKEIVESVQGRIAVESQIGRGSRFSVFLKRN